MMNDRLKEIIFGRLNDKLSTAEVFNFLDDIWVIDRKRKYWYFEYMGKENTLYWRHSFFYPFFSIFSLDHRNEFEPYLCEWFSLLTKKEITGAQWVEGYTDNGIDEVLESGLTNVHWAEYPNFLRIEMILKSS